MEIPDELVIKIGKLAHLELSADEIPALRGELGAILEHVDQLQKVNVTDVSAMSHVHGASNVFREDVVQPSLEFGAAKVNAPDTSGTFFRVPLIIED